MTTKRRGQITSFLRQRIVRGLQTSTTRGGARLPSTRALAAELGVDPRVVLSAYRELAAEGLVELRERSGAYVVADPNEREVLTDVRDDEVTHREFLRLAIPALGGTAIGNLSASFTSALTSRTTILQTARSFEDLGVAAYNGAGKYLTNADILTVAGKIVSVEARHAAAIRDILDPAGTAFANVSDIEGTSTNTGLGANNAQGLDGALEPMQVLTRVAATGVLQTQVSIGTGPIAAPPTT